MTHKIITINRMYGSNGRIIGKALSETLGIHFYDKELIQLASEKNNIPYEELIKVDEKRASQWRLPVNDPLQMQPQYRLYPMNDVLFESQSQIIRALGKRESCIIVGRCANHVLGRHCLSVLIHAPLEDRIQTIAGRRGIEEKSARSIVKSIDKERRSYYEYFTAKKWLDFSQYDLCINSSRFSKEAIVAMLADAYYKME